MFRFLANKDFFNRLPEMLHIEKVSFNKDNDEYNKYEY